MNNEKYADALDVIKQILERDYADELKVGNICTLLNVTRPPANDADVVAVMIEALRIAADELSESLYLTQDERTTLAQAALTALQSAGYRITREGV